MTETIQINKYDSKAITAAIRQEVKERFPQCKFSITKDSYSGGWALHINLMEATFNPFRTINSFDEVHHTYNDGLRTLEQLNADRVRGYSQLNRYQLVEEWKPEHWCNGAFLTKEAHEILAEVVRITDKYNWDNSDAQTDYFDVNFYVHLSIGKWDKPFTMKNEVPNGNN